jgi:thioredoxin 1
VSTSRKGCPSSRVDIEDNLEDILKKSKERVFVLFYASWCGFSRRFLPVFEQFEQDENHKCARIIIDDKPVICEKYSIDVVPTVILFENGKVAKRLDGVPGAGIGEKQFKNFVKNC